MQTDFHQLSMLQSERDVVACFAQYGQFGYMPKVDFRGSSNFEHQNVHKDKKLAVDVDSLVWMAL